ncbi:DegT/DnrJ/EryC1/StrS family aminotransferase [Pelagibacterales bacterium SAG-MED47]|nr:DegT/DnrJ/EryC1/StrS family aminotransferase [Pelagibacterales bacterium SAG-MED47]
MKSVRKTIQLHTPNIFGNETKYLKECIKSNYLTFGKHSELFLKKIKNVTNSKYPALVHNCTSGLYMCLKIADTKKDDEVIVPSITFIASINVVKYCSANPIFMDVDEYCNIDLKKTKEFILKETFYKNGKTFNKKTKKKISSIIIVHTFGNIVNLEKSFIELCKKRSIIIIEDAAESLGSFYVKNNRKYHAGTIGSLGSISFNGNKIITSAGGGVVLTNNKSLKKKVVYLSNQAKDDDVNFIHNEVGYNFRLSNIHAAIGLAQIENLKKIIFLKKKIHNEYKKRINKISGLSLINPPIYSKSNYWINILKIDNKYKFTKKFLLKKLISKKIQVRSVWFPNHLQKPYNKCQTYKIKMANKIFKNYMCLPSSSSLKLQEIKYIVDNLK